MTDRMRRADDGRDPCTGCPALDGRRQFLRNAAVLAVGALAALGAAPDEARALPVRFISALGAHATQKSYAIPTADSVNIDKDAGVIIARYQAQVFAFSLSCPHQNTALRWNDAEHEFQCPKHHSRYTPDGLFIDGRATRSMDRFAVTRSGGNIVVDLDTLYQEDDNPAQWKAAVLHV
ncbi:MAG TPA: Rieske 2Fe-2S domain-containing protein [Gemmatimonadaceae bacterium]|jgi:nitrite reductase/ring-hydroxylating ferredoxin subunit|nr:Rieske 2Fe-2S domain-containing protein [Gemmatimonadaceae bacterium]